MKNKFSAVTDGADPLFHQAKPPVTGVLLVNLGTPDAPTAPALRRYLAEFLADPRVIEIPKIVWNLVLHGIILRVRPKKSAAKYKTIWTEEGSPLLAISKRQANAIQTQLGETAIVKLGMRYGNPSIVKALREFQQEGVRKIIVLPLYPQYAAATTGSTFDAVTREIQKWRFVPELHFINNYCDHPLFIDALAASIQEDFAQHGQPEKLLLSYHGMPKRNLDLGDPYFCLCQKTTRLVAAKLGLQKDEYLTTFQSRFGYAEWLQPYTDATLEELAKSGVKNVAIISPAFSADCLETLEELALENREIFLHAGGLHYRYIAALNDRKDHIEALVALINSKL
ncbi:ferrochelatase 2 [Cellvibrio zantedeschiae]|uniref:Ferrochelatase n=1 Tax=Cellvibrio zantedeschiae TaxID=1237077 RepID=A0ABQ3BA10_9GAMM|nr:ferrochelatase [Cellvibrio zantedeschiae]GGY86433.1 ferrochelatase 2 [Cellvibrio zantedeschiae]